MPLVSLLTLELVLFIRQSFQEFVILRLQELTKVLEAPFMFAVCHIC